MSNEQLETVIESYHIGDDVLFADASGRLFDDKPCLNQMELKVACISVSRIHARRHHNLSAILRTTLAMHELITVQPMAPPLVSQPRMPW